MTIDWDWQSTEIDSQLGSTIDWDQQSTEIDAQLKLTINKWLLHSIIDVVHWMHNHQWSNDQIKVFKMILLSYIFTLIVSWYFQVSSQLWLYHDTMIFIIKNDKGMKWPFLLHLSCLYHFGYVHWLYHDTFKLWINIECIMIQSRVKP